MRDYPDNRLFSLDLLRGLDMFFLAAVGVVMQAAFKVWNCPVWLQDQFRHPWLGFSAWDIIMPLFIFMCGAAMPFALGRRLREGKGVFWRHVLGRVALLWILGMVVQGGLLSLDPKEFSPYCNTLQSIACGYLVTALGSDGMPGEGRRNMLSFYTYFSMEGFGLDEPAGDVLVKDVSVSGAERFLQYNYSGNERYSRGVPLTDMTFEGVRASGIGRPICAYGDENEPLSLTLKGCILEFGRTTEEMIHGANLHRIRFEDTKVDGVSGCVLRNYGNGSAAKIEASNLIGVKPDAVRTEERFSVKAI